MAERITVMMMMRVPEEIPAKRGQTENPRLTAMETRTTPRMTLFFLAAGMMTARNIPYRATLRALTSRSGRMFPTEHPRKVPVAQPGMATTIMPK